MAYTRGKYYIYEDASGKFSMGGVFIPKNIIDEFVVMRYAELEKEGRLKKVEKSAIKKWKGNFGCDALLERYGKETTAQAMERLLSRKTKKKDKNRK